MTWSAGIVHEPLVDKAVWLKAQERFEGDQVGERTRRAESRRPYVLRGILRCGLCLKRMQGQPNHGSIYYGCRFSSNYPTGGGVDHPRTVYLRQDQVEPHVDRWLVQLFDADHIETTVDALVAASTDDSLSPRVEMTMRKITECDRRLAGYRKSIDAGVAPATVVQ